jgi:hypothetical protein
MGIEAGDAHDTGATPVREEAIMPNGVYPVPKFRASAHRRRRPAAVRIRLWWRRSELDEQLAAGVAPHPGTLLYDRAEELASPENRARLASALEHLLRDARRPRPSRGARMPIRARQIRECDEDVLALVRRLRDDHAVDVQGVAMVTVLLANPSGPLARAGDSSVRIGLRSARLALDHVDEPEVAFADAA